ncbi:TPA: glycosyltransferase, partial [Pasteurella multocida]|nr:glycosyltransferase [Pasteurella multocida]
LSKINKTEENRIKKYIKNKEFDLIVNFNSHLDFFLSNNQINIPIIRWIHGQAHLDDWCNRIEWYQNILPKHTYFFAITKEMQKNAQKILLSYGIQEERIHILYNPIDINFIQEQSIKNTHDIHHKQYLINVSRLDIDKNHEQMINIYYQLKKRGIQEKLYIVGDGECREKLEKQIESLNLQEDCFLLGNKDNPY